MTNRYKIYPEINFGVSKIKSGKVKFSDLYDIALKFRKDKNFSKVHYQLTDMRGCIFDFSPDKIVEMKNLVDLYKESDTQKIGVYIVDLPNETALIHMFFELLGRNRLYCSTIEKAYSILSLSISFEVFKEKINF